MKRIREPLRPEEAEGLARHLERCAGCRAEEAEDAAFGARLGEASRRFAAPAGLRPPDRNALRAAGLGSCRQPALPWRQAGWVVGMAAAGTVAVVLLPRPPARKPPVLPRAAAQRSQPQEEGSKPAPVPVQIPIPPAIPGIGKQSSARTGPQPAPLRLQSPEPTAPPRRPIPDEQYLNGADPRWTADWFIGDPADPKVQEWLKRLPPVQDDFVTVPLPQLAAAPGSPALAEAVQNYAREAGVVDPRLARRVTLRLKAAPLSELCERLGRETEVQLEAARGVADENVTVLVKDAPARDVMREVARLFGYRWVRSGEEGSYRYQLYQDLRSQVAEEEMRSQDLHAALLALDAEMAELQPYLGLSPQQVEERLKKAQPAEKKLLKRLQGQSWGTVQMYHRLTPAQRLALAGGERLLFKTNADDPDLRVPDLLKRPILETLNWKLGTFEGEPALVGQGFGQGTTPIQDLPDSLASVSLFMSRSELGKLTLGGQILGELAGRPELKRMFLTNGQTLVSATSPSVAKPDNAAANTRLKGTGRMKQAVSLKPEPSCPWFRPGARPVDVEGFALKMGTDTLYFGLDGETGNREQPHVASADVWEAVHQATGLPVIADAYSQVFDAGRFRMEQETTFDALCQVGDALGVRWRMDGSYLLARSTGFFWEKRKEVPSRFLRRWQEDHRKNGTLPLEDLLEMALLPDAALDARVVGFTIGHCWGLEEWGMVGSGGSFRLGLPGGAYVRPYARFIARLSPAQREQVLRPEGLAYTQLGPAQQETVLDLLFDNRPEPGDLEGLRLTVEYAPVGTFLWHPSVENSKEAEQANGKWPMVTGKSLLETLAVARRINPAAQEGEVKKSRGALNVRFWNAAGKGWQRGGPAISFRLGQ